MVNSCNFRRGAVFLWQQPAPPMKTALISVLTATLLGFASLASGRHFDAAGFTAIMFTAGLVAWTIEQYSRAPRALTVVRTFRFPAQVNANSAKVPAIRLAA
jgi:hypothetical protein